MVRVLSYSAASVDREKTESALKSSIRAHNGKLPQAGTLLKWVKADQENQGGLQNLSRKSLISRVKRQNILEKAKLIDCRRLLQCELYLPKLIGQNDRLDERSLYKEIFEVEMQVSKDEECKSLKTIEENIENEFTTEKKPQHRELILDNPTHKFVSEKHKIEAAPSTDHLQSVYSPEEEDEEGQSRSIYEISKIERALFRSKSKERSGSPHEYRPLLGNAPGTSVEQERRRLAHACPINEIRTRACELERMVRNEIDLCEERSAMTGLLTAFKQLLSKYEEQQNLTPPIRNSARDSHRRLLAPREAPDSSNSKQPYLAIDSYMATKTAPAQQHVHLRAISGFDIYKKRQPLQLINSNTKPAPPSQSSLLRAYASGGNRFQEESAECIDLSVLRNHNFSVDLISAFQ